MDSTLDGVRQLWKEYGLNNSEGAGMQITYESGEVKSHGKVYRDDEFRYCFTDFVVRKPDDADGGQSAGNRKRTRKSK